MPDDVILTVRFRVKKDKVEEFKTEFVDIYSDFMDESIGTQEGEITESPAE